MNHILRYKRLVLDRSPFLPRAYAANPQLPRDGNNDGVRINRAKTGIIGTDSTMAVSTLLVANLSAVDHGLVPLFLSAQGTINRHSHRASGSSFVHVTGFDDSEAGQLSFLQAHYGFAVRHLADPWALFDTPAARSALTHVALCGSADAPVAQGLPARRSEWRLR